MKTQYEPIKCKECFQVIGYFPYRNKNLAVSLFYGKFICKGCKEAKKR